MTLIGLMVVVAVLGLVVAGIVALVFAGTRRDRW